MSADITFKLDKVKSKVKKLSNNNLTLKVGFLDAIQAQKAVQNEYGGQYPISEEYRRRAEQAGVHFGAEKTTINIIPRPFMQTTVDKNKKVWKESLIKLLKNNEPKVALSQLGSLMKADIQGTISNNDFEENPAPYSKIKGRNRPLIDTGEMRRSVDFEVKSG